MKLSIGELMDVAHAVASESFGQESFNFSSLWTKTWAKAKDFRKENLEEWIGSFYVELLLDPRFVYMGTDQWKLREFMDYSEYLKVVGKRAQEVSFKELEIETDVPDKEKIDTEETQDSVKEEISEEEEEDFDEESDGEASKTPSDNSEDDSEDNYD